MQETAETRSKSSETETGFRSFDLVFRSLAERREMRQEEAEKLS